MSKESKAAWRYIYPLAWAVLAIYCASTGHPSGAVLFGIIAFFSA